MRSSLKCCRTGPTVNRYHRVWSGAHHTVVDASTGGSVVMTAAGFGSSSRTYAVDGENIIVSIDKQKHPFSRGVQMGAGSSPVAALLTLRFSGGA